MNPIQEAKQELEASIRYAENAIGKAKQAIEQAATYQEQTGREQALEAEVAELNKQVEFYTQKYSELAQGMGVPTMPVIPKDVAIAIFRAGLAQGAEAVATEIDNTSDIEVSDRECMGNFEVEYTQYVELSDHLDLDFLRSAAVDNADEEWVVDCLNNLCADKKFECRIHGVDDNPTEK